MREEENEKKKTKTGRFSDGRELKRDKVTHAKA